MLFAKSNGERLKSHTKKTYQCITHLKELLGNQKEKFSTEFWEYLEYAAIAHDFGKAIDSYQELLSNLKVEGPEKSTKYRERVNRQNIPPHSLLSPVFMNWFGRNIEKEWLVILLHSIVFHHNRAKINDLINENCVPDVKPSELEALKDEMRDFNPDISDLIAKEIGTINKMFLKFLTNYGSQFRHNLSNTSVSYGEKWERKYVFFKGFLIRADHFASSLKKDEYEIRNFELPVADLATIERKIQVMFSKQKEDIWQFNKIQELELRGQNTILIGSTGIGKTEFSFLWSLGKKTFYTLPMRAMTDEIFKRAVKIFGSQIGLLHSSALAVLPGILREEGGYEDVEAHIGLSRSLSFPFIVSTGDQILNVSLKYPTYEKVLATLGYSNLIVDEIQSYSPETSAIIVKTIETVSKMGGTFLLMTATLPEYIKEEILKRTEIKPKHLFTILSKEGEKDIVKNFIKVENIKGIVPQNEVSQVQVESFYESLKRIILAHKEKRILITLNTVKNSQALYNLFLNDESFWADLSLGPKNTILLHSRFIGKDRCQKIDRITSKNLSISPIKIVITTQVIEASVDIDFDILITELAPLDSMTQRMGRVNRNRGSYSEKNSNGTVYVIDAYLPGSDFVYKKESLETTSQILKEKELNNSFLSESKKLKILEDYYSHDGYRCIRSQFRKNLEIMDKLLIATSKNEAQKIFREVNTLTVIPFERIEEFIGEIRKSDFEPLLIKRALLDFSLSVRYQLPSNSGLIDLGDFLNKDPYVDMNIVTKYLKGYYTTNSMNWTYDKDIGLLKK